MPWTLQFSTNIINPSYVLPAALVFFIGFFESMPAFSLGSVRPAAHASWVPRSTWLMQIHMSWPLLAPVCGAGVARAGVGDGAAPLAVTPRPSSAGALAAGAVAGADLAAYGARGRHGGALRNFTLHWVNPRVIVTTLARFLSFASLEINRFIATDGAKRLAFFERHLWLAPLALSSASRARCSRSGCCRACPPARSGTAPILAGGAR